MKLAILLSIHSNPDLVNRFIRQVIYDKDVTVFIHVDKKYKDIEKDIVKNDQVHIVNNSIEVTWGDYTQIENEIILLSYAKKQGDYDYYSLHTGNDILVRPIQELKEYLEKTYYYAYLDCNKLPWKDWQYGGGLGRLAIDWPIEFRNKLQPHSAKRYLRSILGKMYGAGLIKGKVLPNIDFYGKSAYFVLRKDCVEDCLNYIQQHPEYLDLFKSSLCGDEIFFNTLVNLVRKNNIVINDNNLRYIDFINEDKKKVGSPKTLTIEDINSIHNSGAFFARKVDSNVDDKIITYFEEYTRSGEKKDSIIKYPVRVLNLFTTLDRGGAETMVMNYYRNIDRSKIQFDFIVHREEIGAYEDEIIRLGGKIYRLPRLTSFFQYQTAVNSFFDIHKEYKIIHSHMSENGLFCFIKAKQNKVPVRICHAHNAPQTIDMKIIVKNMMKKMIKPLSTHFFSCSKEAAVWLYGASENVYYLKNAVNTDQFSYTNSTKQKVKSQLKINEDTLIFGHIGRFHEQKNHSFIIEIYNEIYKKNNNTRLLLIGDGELRNPIKKKAKDLGLLDNMLFMGIREDVPDLLQCMDVMIFPSLYEGLPVTLVEAQSSGLKCLISDQISKEAIIVPELMEIMSLDESAEEWAIKALEISCYERHDRKKELTENGFDIQKNAEWLQAFYLKEAGVNE